MDGRFAREQGLLRSCDRDLIGEAVCGFIPNQLLAPQMTQVDDESPARGEHLDEIEARVD